MCVLEHRCIALHFFESVPESIFRGGAIVCDLFRTSGTPNDYNVLMLRAEISMNWTIKIKQTNDNEYNFILLLSYTCHIYYT